jgi:hypothetical protein
MRYIAKKNNGKEEDRVSELVENVENWVNREGKITPYRLCGEMK